MSAVVSTDVDSLKKYQDEYELYSPTAFKFALRVFEVFISEATLKREWETHFPLTPFDRTSKWDLILRRMLDAAWKAEGPVVNAPITDYDRDVILRLLSSMLDFNLFSQVYLNLQRWRGTSYRTTDAAADEQQIAAKYAGKELNPTVPKASMVKLASTPEEREYNNDLSTLKALRIISKITPGSVSFRVSPYSATPALTDSNNLSMLGPGGDRYLVLPVGQNNYQAHYLTWDEAPTMLDMQDPPAYTVPKFSYTFPASASVDILNSVLYVRHLITEVYKQIGPDVFMLPRMHSLLVVSTKAPDTSLLRGNPQLSIGSRQL